MSRRARIVARVATGPSSLGPERQASNHRRTRAAHAQEIAEDYVEVIADLIDAGGEARAVDIARRLGVTHVTVTKTVGRLQKSGWVTNRPYRSIFLTESGRRLAESARQRHQTVTRFLQAIGVSESVAHSDAEGIEHHVSDETLRAMRAFVAAK
jgi:DtxR family manganese transport transcriptional regulator